MVAIVANAYRYASIGETTLFGLLGIQLLAINIILLNLMKNLFGSHLLEKNFKHEMRFLISTLILFSISYLVSVLRNIFIFYLLENELDNDQD